MLGKRDEIFWAASVIFLVAVALGAFVDNAYLLLMVASYLLRPTVHSLGFLRRLVDERQLHIQYQASNVGFAALVAGLLTVILVLMRRGDHTWEMLVAVLMVGLTVRALTGLLLVGDPLVAGVRILVALGLLLALLGVLEGGAGGMMSHVLPGLGVAGLGLAGKRWPRPAGAGVLAITVLVAVALLRGALGRGAGAQTGTLIALALIAVPATIAGVCLMRGTAEGDSQTERVA